jgi:hypothetical protein
LQRIGVRGVQAGGTSCTHFKCTSRVNTNIHQGEWLATGLESGTKFAAIDLDEGEWFDYDEKAGDEVSIKDLKWEISRN